MCDDGVRSAWTAAVRAQSRAAISAAACVPTGLRMLGASAITAWCSHGPQGQLDAPSYISIVVIRTEYTKARMNDATARGWAWLIATRRARLVWRAG